MPLVEIETHLDVDHGRHGNAVPHGGFELPCLDSLNRLLVEPKARRLHDVRFPMRPSRPTTTARTTRPSKSAFLAASEYSGSGGPRLIQVETDFNIDKNGYRPSI